MTTIQADLRKRLCFILHRGFVEVRNLAGVPGFAQQIHDLADAMEILPRFLDVEPSVEDMQMIRFVLNDYQSRYPTAKFDYLAFLDQCDPPDRY